MVILVPLSESKEPVPSSLNPLAMSFDFIASTVFSE